MTYTIPFACPNIGEEEQRAVRDVLFRDQLTNGREVEAFEQAFIQAIGRSINWPVSNGQTHAVAASSCMGALHLAYLALDIGPGDQVLCPALSHVATALAIEQVGAEPVFVDCDEYGRVTVEGLEAAARKSSDRRLKAASVVHFLGWPCDMPAITKWTQDQNLFLVEDCALALGTTFNSKHVGLWGDVGCFSFYPTKLITTGEGGMLLTQSLTIAEPARRLRQFGVLRQADGYEVVGERPGLNYRMTEMAAAIGQEQLKKASKFARLRKMHAAHYTKRFTQAGLGQMIFCPDEDEDVEKAPLSSVDWSPYAFAVRFSHVRAVGCSVRDSVRDDLQKAHIGTSVYYPRPIPEMNHFRNKYHDPNHYPNAQAICEQVLCLPCHPRMSDKEVDYVADAVIESVGLWDN